MEVVSGTQLNMFLTEGSDASGIHNYVYKVYDMAEEEVGKASAIMRKGKDEPLVVTDGIMAGLEPEQSSRNYVFVWY